MQALLQVEEKAIPGPKELTVWCETCRYINKHSFNIMINILTKDSGFFLGGGCCCCFVCFLLFQDCTHGTWAFPG